ncbi:hypothetical protein ACRQ5D_18315 [Mucilaginibacter sp. P25]|uniref:hypothetical protein n=1 Tax=Mucilaginibacter sp. P25 TaxID=3423945 RepID=UPI003D7A1B61
MNVNDVVLNGRLKVNIKGIAPYTFTDTASFRKGMQINKASLERLVMDIPDTKSILVTNT